jgi:hypothetical protein
MKNSDFRKSEQILGIENVQATEKIACATAPGDYIQNRSIMSGMGGFTSTDSPYPRTLLACLH